MPENIPARPITFTGEFQHSIDIKNRITIPADWRTKGGADEFQVVPDKIDPFLCVMPTAEFDKVAKAIEEGIGDDGRERRVFLRRYSGGARKCTLDSHGRLLLPADYCEKIGLKGEVTLIGAYSRFEIWDPEVLREAEPSDMVIYKKLAKSAGI